MLGQYAIGCSIEPYVLHFFSCNFSVIMLYFNKIGVLQVLLKPIVSQFVVEPPESIESVVDAPSVEEVDEALVLCLGQMAVTARSDVLWKPLNHEVGS